MPDTPSPRPAAHPLLFAGKGLLRDFLSTIAFLIVFEATGHLAVAVAVAIAVGVYQAGYMLLRRRPIDTMQWLSLGLLVVFGGASIISGNYIFYRFKFTLIYAAIGSAMLVPSWINVYVPPVARERGGDVNTAFGYIWSGLFFATAALNLALVAWARPQVWAWFIGVFPIASKVVLVGAQYVVTKTIIRQRIRELPPLAA